ncbi:flagellar hook-basal body protein FliE [Paracoccus sp. S-4012]|uniref:flagellar hook-basal body complex protein FliE n=1 Tax=Paracoccus sp. S-4012 TaxID=2665648 RepID=UPI0012B0FA64|nr:flagellar hook-basal body complex protein FliE [Paracoccus sp. S-4012]MRX49248.1 flagellar hook-basal body protein FliE [Paracoccus sp. S-4012]
MISSLSAVSAYDLARPAIAAGGARPAALTPKPGEGLLSSGDRFLLALDRVDGTAQAAMSGSASSQQLVQTIAETEVALETVVAIRDRVVEAYQEILRMPV